ncbi:hypothetical protein [Psychroserpens sp.]|uniref:hypothetical protein n=1 Tax=Psychroserpens sp. TaxID=2020870 RepID=UPI003C77CE34
MKIIKILFFCFIFSLSVNAQSVKGALTLNGSSENELQLKSNSAVQLFKDFKTGKYKLGFEFKSDGLPLNSQKETIVFFDFITIVKKDGKLVKNVQRKQPIPYFPGDMGLPAEAFDFIGVLASSFSGKESVKERMTKGSQGIMPEGKYDVQLIIKPVGYKGEIAPLEFSFKVGKR